MDDKHWRIALGVPRPLARLTLMRVLLTGAAGFIGSSLAERLVARGTDVVGVDCFDEMLYRAHVKRRNLRDLLASPRFQFIHTRLIAEGRPVPIFGDGRSPVVQFHCTVCSMTPEQLAEMEQRLNALRDEIHRRLAGTAEDSRPVDLDAPIGRLSRVDALQGQQMAAEQRRRMATQLQQVQSALLRIRSATYGDCIRCGEAIDIGRLRVRPEVPLCRDCQQGSE